ncbi:LYR motif containing protein 1 isoform X7 [Heterodontus francisci]|uniref:LYR motif containing protein 1 isoform X7 n=1 Tax=Heterodontus francisci TaxID=7792 RepID=UPI00355B4962
MTATRCDVLGLYRRIFRIARTWQSLSGLTDDTLKEKEYIITEARSLFRKNKNDYITEFLTRDQCSIWSPLGIPRKYLDKLKRVEAWCNGSFFSFESEEQHSSR